MRLLKAGFDLPPVRAVALHLRDIVAAADAADLESRVQFGQLGVVQLHAQSRLVGQVDAPSHDGHLATHQHLVTLPRVVGVAGLAEVLYRRGQVRHRHQADTQVRVGMHRQAQPKGLAGLGQRLGGAQAAPVVMV